MGGKIKRQRPARLYKFRAFDRGEPSYTAHHSDGTQEVIVGRLPYTRDLEIFRDHKLYAASASDFNDPYDGLPQRTSETSDENYRQWYTRSLQRHGGDSEKVRHERDALLRLHAQGLTGDLRFTYLHPLPRVLCLTADHTNILMWSHYAANHEGYCLEFDATCAPLKSAKPVTYSSSRAKVSLFSLDYTSDIRAAQFRKASCWKYEKEFRLILGDGKRQIDFQPDALTAVIIGCRASPDDLATLYNIVRQHAPHAKFKRAVAMVDKYALDFQTVDP